MPAILTRVPTARLAIVGDDPMLLSGQDPAKVAALQAARVESADHANAAQAAVAVALAAAAERIEGITKKLNQPAGAGVALG